uniref:Uncharacterized protein n=1 Tax=Ectopseudomonas oleovorans TaxID=301 RepID=A0A653B5R8_ECTOL
MTEAQMAPREKNAYNVISFSLFATTPA